MGKHWSVNADRGVNVLVLVSAVMFEQCQYTEELPTCAWKHFVTTLSWRHSKRKQITINVQKMFKCCYQYAQKYKTDLLF